jgi:hypothetical protein
MTTMGSLLYEERSDGEAAVRARIETASAVAAVLAAAAGLGPYGRGAVVDQVTRAVLGLLDLPFEDVVLAGVQKYVEVAEAARRTAATPGSEELLELQTRQLTSVHRPVVEVEVDGVPVARFQLELRLLATLRGLMVTVAGGRITQLLGGQADVVASFDVDGFRLAEWRGTTGVAMSVPVSAPVPLWGAV